MFKRLFIAIIILSLLSFSWYFQAIQPVSPQISTRVDFEIKPGTGIDRIANELSSAQLIRSRVAFKLTVIRLGVASKIQAGLFKLSPNMSATEMAHALTRAYSRQVRVTIPEGLRGEELNSIFDKAFGDFKENTYNPSEFSQLTKNMEGRLFPDTYDFSPVASASDVVKKLTARYSEVTDSLSITTDQLIIASLLEREAFSAEEMPLVAGVIANRLKIGMALQIDATVQYAVGSANCKQIICDWWKKNLTKEDLKINSPYNTYQNPGLPKGPISNPGKDALVASVNPAKISALYYLHDNSGKIHFADTYEEHVQNVCTYLRKDCR